MAKLLFVTESTLLVNFWLVMLRGPFADLLLDFFEGNVPGIPETKSRCSFQDSVPECIPQTTVTGQFPSPLPPPYAAIPRCPAGPCSHTTCQAMLWDKPRPWGKGYFFSEPPDTTTPGLGGCRCNLVHEGNCLQSLLAQGE